MRVETLDRKRDGAGPFGAEVHNDQSLNGHTKFGLLGEFTPLTSSNKVSVV